MGNNVFETTDPIKMDKELHHSERENKFHLGDNNSEKTIHFILDKKEFSMINFVILLVSIAIVSIVLIIVLAVLLCGKKSLKYERQENEYTPDSQPEEINNSGDNSNESGENKISFEETDNNINNLDKDQQENNEEEEK